MAKFVDFRTLIMNSSFRLEWNISLNRFYLFFFEFTRPSVIKCKRTDRKRFEKQITSTLHTTQPSLQYIDDGYFKIFLFILPDHERCYSLQTICFFKTVFF